ncbi:MAG: polyphosphate kinase 1 [Butyricicoccus sp.]
MLPRELLVNRELSWLEFNKRVLNEALRQDVPLLERLKFAAIYFSNLDEFFMVRVGSLTDQSIVKPTKLDDKTGWTAAEQVRQILKTLHSYRSLTEEMFQTLKTELKTCGVDFVKFKKIKKSEEKFAEKYFANEIAPFLSPQIVDRHHPFPFLRNKEKYVVTAMTSKSGTDRIGIIPIGHLPDYFAVNVDGRTKVFFTSDIVEQYASKLFLKQKIVQALTIRVTRNADIRTDDALVGEGMDFRDIMQDMLKKRRRLFAVRLQLSKEPLLHLKEELCKQLRIEPLNVFVQDIPLDFGFGFSLGSKIRSSDPALTYPDSKPFTPDKYKGAIPMRQLADKEILLAYPFHSYNPFLNLLYEAADDPEVISIKISLYRLAGHSKVVSALCRAADKGKDVLAMMELRARFDEQSNIDYSEILEEAGCRVIYGLSDYKVHAKLCLITRKNEQGEVSYTTQIGTGNYNEKTSEQYTDLCFITNDHEVGLDASDVFNALSMGETVERTRALWAAPNCFRTNLMDLIEREIEVQKAGGRGYIAMKINSMNDVGVMEKLVEASQAGVTIKLYVRGICCLRPGVKGYTENIRIRALIGRYLEHSRIYVFGEGERQEIFIGSGDLLNRNTQRRVEIFAQPKSPEIRAQLLHIMELQEQDNVQMWQMKKDGTFKRVPGDEGDERVSSQIALRDYFVQLNAEERE